MRTTALTLEAFSPLDGAPEPARRPRAVPDAPPPPVEESIETRLARARGEGRAEGFAEGVAEAEARGLAAIRLIGAELREQIQDARLALAQRRDGEAADLRALTEALLTGVAPALARHGLAAEVAEAAAEALRGVRGGLGAGAEIGIRVAPAQCAAVALALAQAGLGVSVTSDPTLGDLHARLDWADGEDVIDLSAALDAARAALDRHLNPTWKVSAHG